MTGLRYIALLVVAMSACSFDRDEHAQACLNDDECDAGTCYEQLCIDDSASGESCAQGSQIEVCYEGPEKTRAVGMCSAGQRICIESALSECLGQVLPAREVCNGKDDDCDGRVDDVEASAACDSHLQGACGEGRLVCRGGVELCQPVRESQRETCNEVDDDCDGNTDELLSAGLCYPPDVEGCSVDAEGAWQCNGLCATGFTECEEGAGDCGGASTPQQEACTTGSTLAQDEDCDGLIDESCDCSQDASRDCYAGPANTLGHGRCRAGTQRCDNLKWGACAHQIVPSPEDCGNPNSDDDCNELVDDVLGLGSACIAEGASGLCRDGTLACLGSGQEPRCVAGAALAEVCDDVDQDCDGDPANGFDFTSNESCGGCGVRCSAQQTCCNGQCMAVTQLQEDVANCGSCGQACGNEQYCCQGRCLSVGTMHAAACDCHEACGDEACCGMECRDLETHKDNCGACGRKCGKDKICVDAQCEDKP